MLGRTRIAIGLFILTFFTAAGCGNGRGGTNAVAETSADRAGATRAAEGVEKPGINDEFKGEVVVEKWVERFERESREIYKHRDRIANLLGLRAGLSVADIGAGTGFFTLMFADRVSRGGKVYAVDIAQGFLDHIARQAEERGFTQVRTVKNPEDSVGLPPRSINLAFICDTYHHFEHPREMMRSIHEALAPGGEVFVVDFYRDEDQIAHLPPDRQEWLRDHVRCGKAEMIREVMEAGFEPAEEQPETPWLTENYVVRFRRVD